ncbi:MAG: ligase-associated DNA damage response DEXH box helicase [Phycisphaeraceae bacterium]|nr:MAG: ligase-associated DNA damage response DEXH box helicase [Phycisphaeraceae bacterium]
MDSPRTGGSDAVRAWFAAHGMRPHEFQERAWKAYADARGGLIQVPTGSGKTYAAFGGPLAEIIDEARDASPGPPPPGIRVLYVSPLRAVARDITLALERPLRDLGLPARVQTRTGDTAASVRAAQRQSLPEVLVTTPESLSILLTRENARALFATLRAVIVDEWHELLASKRGSQVELALARLRTFAPGARVWGMSATIANADAAARALVGVGPEPIVITAPIVRPVVVRSVLPDEGVDLPWAGHLGLSMLPKVAEALDPEKPTLIFTNTRAQAELWHRALLALRPEWEPITALHHGSIDRDERERAEGGIKDGSVRFVVATSSLDLGVDFAPVERAVQIGSPKGIGRIVQRAGRASHRPGEPCEILCVPTHALELIEIDAVRRALALGVMEPREPINAPLDVLAQHLVTCAMGGGFDPDELFREVRLAWSYRDLPREEFDWVLAMVRDGGAALSAYERFKKVRPVADGHGRTIYRVTDQRLATLHRFNVGTIVSDATVEVRLRSGWRLGSVEEGFAAVLRPGERFIFSGRVLRFVKLENLTCWAEPAGGSTSLTPHWAGTKLPITERLGEMVRASLARACAPPPPGPDEPELARAMPLIDAQRHLSIIPGPDEVLAEVCRTREGTHLFLFPFAGRLVHAGLAAITALRLTRRCPATFAASVNDYGFELLTADDVPFETLLTPDLFDPATLAADALESVNVAEIAKSQFREVARVSGLVFQSYPGSRVRGRQTQASSSLIYDVFAEFDPGNLLLLQARREVLERQFEHSRLARTMGRLGSAASSGRLRIVAPPRPTPLAYPLIVERVSALFSGETLEQRLAKMRAPWDRATPSSPSDPPRPRVARKPRGLRSSL